MDGTLTVAAHDFDAMRDELGLPPGEPILEALSRLPAKQSEAIMLRLDAMEWQLADTAQPQPGAHELLTHLARQNRQLGIVTRNGTSIAKKTLQVCGLDQFFSKHVIVGRETCAPKPHPAGITHLLDHWRACRDHAVMVGDHLIDMQAGRAAGVKTAYFNTDDNIGSRVAADVHVSTLAQLIPLS